MPILKSAKKYMRVTSRRRTVNDRRRRALKENDKVVTEHINAKDAKAATEALPKYFKAVDKAAKAGVLKKNTAARKKSRMTKRIAKLG